MTSHKLTTLACGFLGGILFSVVVGSPLLAQAFVSWSKREVVPVVLVEPAIGGFAPVNGSAIGNIWPKDRVVPMCKVKPSIGGFAPEEGSSIGNIWTKEQTKAVVIVEPSLNGFEPADKPCL